MVQTIPLPARPLLRTLGEVLRFFLERYSVRVNGSDRVLRACARQHRNVDDEAINTLSDALYPTQKGASPHLWRTRRKESGKKHPGKNMERAESDS